MSTNCQYYWTLGQLSSLVIVMASPALQCLEKSYTSKKWTPQKNLPSYLEDRANNFYSSIKIPYIKLVFLRDWISFLFLSSLNKPCVLRYYMAPRYLIQPLGSYGYIFAEILKKHPHQQWRHFQTLLSKLHNFMEF